MHPAFRRQHAIAVALLFATASAAMLLEAQQKKKKAAPAQQQEQKSDDDQQQQQQPSPPQPSQRGGLLKGKVTLKSSRSGAGQQASAGFNGVGPDGHVDQSKLASAPTAADQQKATQLAAFRVDSSDVEAFAKQGKLNAGWGQTAGK